MVEIVGDDCLGSWQSGAELLTRTKKEMLNLVTTIQNQTVLDPLWLTRFNPAAYPPGKDQIKDVINTIIPIRWAFTLDRKALYKKYLHVHDRAKNFRRNNGAWGTYFERLIRFGRPNGPNQLEIVVEKLTKWERRVQTALVLHLSAPSLDSPRTRGGPCWHFGEFIWHSDDKLDLVVVYRNHDFYNKALGNYVALGQLLRFVCEQSKRRPGKLICHSVHAYFDSSINSLKTFASI